MFPSHVFPSSFFASPRPFSGLLNQSPQSHHTTASICILASFLWKEHTGVCLTVSYLHAGGSSSEETVRVGPLGVMDLSGTNNSLSFDTGTLPSGAPFSLNQPPSPLDSTAGGTLSWVNRNDQDSVMRSGIVGDEIVHMNSSAEAFTKLMISMASMARPGSFEEARGGVSVAGQSRFGRDNIFNRRGAVLSFTPTYHPLSHLHVLLSSQLSRNCTRAPRPPSRAGPITQEAGYPPRRHTSSYFGS